MAFADRGTLLLLSTLVSVQPPSSPVVHDLNSFWVVLAESPDLLQGTLELVGRSLWHTLVHEFSVLGLETTRIQYIVYYIFFHLQFQSFRQRCAWEEEEVAKSWWSGPAGKGSVIRSRSMWRRLLRPWLIPQVVVFLVRKGQICSIVLPSSDVHPDS